MLDVVKRVAAVVTVPFTVGGGILIMLNERLFKFWHDLPEALRTGRCKAGENIDA